MIIMKNLTHVVFSHGKESGPFGSKIQCLMTVAEEMGTNLDAIKAMRRGGGET